MAGPPTFPGWPAPEGGADEAIVIELLDDSTFTHDGGDVAFGMRARRGSSAGANPPGARTGHKRGLIGALAVIGCLGAAGVGAAVIGNSEAMTSETPPGPTGAPTTTSPTVGGSPPPTGGAGQTVPPERPPRSSEPVPTTPGPATPDGTPDGIDLDSMPSFDPIQPSTPPTTAVLALATAPFELGDGPTGLFLTPSGWGVFDRGDELESGATAWRLDLTTGNLEPFGGSAAAGGVVATADGPAIIEQAELDVGTPVFVTDRGTMWRLNPTGNALVEIDVRTGEVLDLVDTLGPFSQVLGVSFDNRPVILGMDADSYSVLPDGTFARFADGVAYDLQVGGYRVVGCDQAMRCLEEVRGRQGTYVRETTGDPFSRVEFSPSGRWALERGVADDRGPQLIDLVGGTTTDIVMAANRSAPVFDDTPLPIAAIAWFGVNDRYAVARGAQNNLLVVDTLNATVTPIELPTGWADARILGAA